MEGKSLSPGSEMMLDSCRVHTPASGSSGGVYTGVAPSFAAAPIRADVNNWDLAAGAVRAVQGPSLCHSFQRSAADGYKLRMLKQGADTQS